jgi:hypothetical protein
MSWEPKEDLIVTFLKDLARDFADPEVDMPRMYLLGAIHAADRLPQDDELTEAIAQARKALENPKGNG